MAKLCSCIQILLPRRNRERRKCGVGRHYLGTLSRQSWQSCAGRPPGHAASGCCRAAGGGLGAAARASAPSAPDNEEQIYYNGRMEPCCSENILQKFCFCILCSQIIHGYYVKVGFFGLLWCTVSASPFSLFFSLFGAIDFSVLKVKFCVLNSISCSPKRAELKTEIIAYNGDYVSIVVCFLTSVLCLCLRVVHRRSD